MEAHPFGTSIRGSGQALVGVLAVLLVGCVAPQGPGTALPTGEAGPTAGEGGAEPTVVAALASAGQAGSAFAEGSPLARLARALEDEARRKSAFATEVLAAEASRRAVASERLPRIVPSAGVPLTGDGGARFGVAVEQTVQDFGRTRARSTAADVRIEQARARAWKEANEAVLAGLQDFVELSRVALRLAALDTLEQRLVALDGLLQDRVSSGAAARGEVLRLAVGMQELRREQIEDRATEDVRRASLARRLPLATSPTPIADLSGARANCRRVSSTGAGPDVLLASLGIAEARSAEAETGSRRFPRILVAANASQGFDGDGDAGIGLRIDTSNLLVQGRADTLLAARATTDAALQRHDSAGETVVAELARIEATEAGLDGRERQLRELLASNRETLVLFEDQVRAGTVQLVDGIDLHREETDTALSIIDTQADLLLACLERARILGQLAPYLHQRSP